MIPGESLRLSVHNLNQRNLTVIISEIEFGTPEYDESIRLRTDILRRPLGLTFDPAALALEYRDFHLGCYDDDWKLVGCLVLTPVSEQIIKMRQVAVAADAQRKGIGARLVHAAEEYARRKGWYTIMCHARQEAIPFYIRMGYAATGPEFTEVNIPHRRMEKLLTA